MTLSELLGMKLSPAAKVLYLILSLRSDEGGRVEADMLSLAEQLDSSDRAVRNWFRELESEKMLRVQRRGLGLSNVYYLLAGRPA